MTLTIGGVTIGDELNSYGAPCRFIAELSNNHNGDYDRAIRLVDAAKASGADIVKWQAYTADELVALRGDGPAPEPWGAQGWTMRSLYEKAATPLEWFPRLFQYCRDIGMPAFSSVFGMDSLAVLERAACPAYKIASLDNGQRQLIDTVIARGKPVVVSSDYGFAQLPERAHHLYCPRGYPTSIEDVRLPHFGQSYSKQRPYIGLSSHCMDHLVPLLAVARRCAVIEMHFQLDEEPSELESDISLTASAFKRMVEDVRRVEAMLTC
jgi:pseudaminic acid synthase